MLKAYALLILFFLSSLAVRAQAIKGVISDEKGEPLPFSKIWIENSSNGTRSNGKGEFILELDSLGIYNIRFSSTGYESITETINVDRDVVVFNVELKSSVLEFEEIQVTTENKRSKGKRIMKQVIDKRKSFLDSSSFYACSTYCFTSLDIRKPPKKGDTITDSISLAPQKLNITEWYGQSYFKANERYKDIITGYTGYTDKAKNTVEVSVSFSDDNLGDNTGSISTNPYIFVNGLKEADINIFRNKIEVPNLTQRPLISPLAYNALVYYNFYLERSFYEAGEKIYEIRVDPVFQAEALFSGTIYIRENSMQPVAYELAVNKAALNYFKEMQIICHYKNIDGKVLPVHREFIYMIKEGRSTIHGNISLSHQDYIFDYDDSQRNFWLETQVYEPEAFDRDTSYWNGIRPFHLDTAATEFIRVQDSIAAYHSSEEYLKQQDSLYNTLTVWDFLFNGVGFRNTYKKQEFYFSSLLEQVIPFGVGGYRHSLKFSYNKEFKNAQSINIRPKIDYGFHNKDLKGSIKLGYVYNPRRFSQFSIFFGDTYDLINNYESIQGTIAPANRVRNQKVKVEHEQELINGLFFKVGATYSMRRAIQNIEYPEWVYLFGSFSEPKPFDDYAIFITEFELLYRFRQRYIYRGNKKIITESRFPELSLLYKKGYPNILGGQSDFDFLELRVYDKIDFKSLGQSEVKLTAGSFLRKKDLRIIENKYFRTSDLFFFSNPVNSMQMLDTSLNTSNSYLQANFIHHFNGFFLNKIWGINKLKLEETVGGGVLMIPDAHFNQVEFYVGIERMFRIKKQLFKIGCYAVASDNNFDVADIRFKFGVNFYDSFRKKWDY